MLMLIKFNIGIPLSLCFIIFSKHAWVISLKDKIGNTTTDTFQNILDKFGHKTK